MMIGSLSRIPYAQFAGAMAPVAAMALVIVFLVLRGLYRAEFRAGSFSAEHIRVRVNRAMLTKSLAVAGGMLVAFFAGAPVAETAMVAGALLLITRRVKPEKVYHDIDWSLLALFAGLFIVTAGLEKTRLPERLFEWARPLGLHTVAGLTAVAAALSNLVSNVPAVLVFRPLLSALPDPTPQWLALAMASTLAGNLTIIGSVANLIVIERARRHAPVTFLEYAKAGVPVTLLSLLCGALWLAWRR
jgi:Na+/H+ antiporter NhaD/arsenite permease-like protein